MQDTGFRNRSEAGRVLARALARYAVESPVIVGLVRGGVPVAFEVARALGAPLDVCVVKKVGAPSRPEFALGAVAEDGASFIDVASARRVGISRDELESLFVEKARDVASGTHLYRRLRGPVDVRGKMVIVVDDGLATGSTARAAIRSVRRRGARRIVLASPVAPPETLHKLRSDANDIVCLLSPRDFRAVGLWYADFHATTDDEVVDLLARASEFDRAHEARAHGT